MKGLISAYETGKDYFSQGDLDTSPGIYRQEAVEAGSFRDNRWSLYDMHGNMAEWVWDVYGTYLETAIKDPEGADAGTLRINRGGSWNDFTKNPRSAYQAILYANESTFSSDVSQWLDKCGVTD